MSGRFHPWHGELQPHASVGSRRVCGQRIQFTVVHERHCSITRAFGKNPARVWSTFRRRLELVDGLMVPPGCLKGEVVSHRIWSGVDQHDPFGSKGSVNIFKCVLADSR